MRRELLVRQYGQDPIAYSTLQDNMKYFDTSFGYIAYRKVMGMDITLGAPVCASHDTKELLERFLSFSIKPVFSYIPKDTVYELKNSRLYCAGMGVDRYVDVNTFLDKPAKSVLGALKKARKANFEIQVMDLSAGQSDKLKRLDVISSNYLKNAQCNFELSFINRPMHYEQDGMKRTFSLCKYDKEHQGIFGYAVLNPYYKDGHVDGYLLDILRFEPTRLWGVWLSAVWHFARLLSNEGYGLALGFCPLYGIQQSPVRSSSWLNWQTQRAAQLLSHSQYVRRLYELKSQIPGWQEPRFFASYSRNLMRNLFAFLNASGMNTSQLLGPELVRSMVAGLTTKAGRL